MQQLLATAKTATQSLGRPVKVWLGLQTDEGAWAGAGGAGEAADGNAYGAWMAKQIQLSKELVDDLWSHYGPGGSVGDYSAQIAGFYLPFEAGSTQVLANDPGPTDWRHGSYRRQVNLHAYWQQVSAAIKTKSSSLGVMVSPYHSAKIGQNPQPPDLLSVYADAVKALLSGTQVTVYAPQDSTGAQLASASEIAPWMVAARNGIDAAGTGTALWANIEAYSMQGVVSQPIAQLVQHMDAVNKPVDGVSANVSTFVGFSARNLNYLPWGQLLVGQFHYAAYRNYLQRGWMEIRVADRSQ